jgi:VanZ family protein
MLFLGKKGDPNARSSRVRTFALIVSLALATIVVLANTGNLGPILHLVGQVPYGDKLAHFVLMGLFAFAVCLALGRRESGRSPERAARLGGIGVFVVVFVEELSQRFVATRTFDLVDLTADFFGIALGATLAYRVLRRGVPSVSAALV